MTVSPVQLRAFGKTSIIALALLFTVPALGQPTAPAALRVAVAGLGDLSAFRTIASDTLKIVETGDLTAARVRIKDLEKAWDVGEKDFKPRDGAGWGRLDKAIDTVLVSLRTPGPDKATCAAALKDLITMFDGFPKQG